MKRRQLIYIIICILIVVATSGCSSKPVKSDEFNATTTAAANAENISENGASNSTPDSNVNSDESSIDGIDIDLASLSKTMVYSEVYNMMYEPDKYIGKTIKMSGIFTIYQDGNTGNYYFACVIQDATACCAQGLEFIPVDDYLYPDDYPDPGDIITVVGVFDTYMEDNYLYRTLRNAKFM